MTERSAVPGTVSHTRAVRTGGVLTPPVGEPRLQGWDEIAGVLGWTKRTAMRHREELRHHRAIFYQWLGKPPRKTVCSYDSVLRAFLLTR